MTDAEESCEGEAMSELLQTLYVVGPVLGAALVFGWCVYRIFLAIFSGDE